MIKRIFTYALLSAGLVAVLVITTSFNLSQSKADMIHLASNFNNGTSKISETDKVTKPQFLQLVTSTPITGQTNVPLNTDISLTFSKPLAADTAIPVLNPPVSGDWTVVNSDTLLFTPAQEFFPFSVLSVTMPGGINGIKSVNSEYLAQTQTMTLTFTDGTVLQLQQYLSTLNYLPLTYNSSTGTFAWNYASVPSSLQALWQQGVYNEMTKAAVMTFEYQNGLAVDGIAGQQVWDAIASDLASNKQNTFGYSYVMVSKVLPENVQVWHNGQIVFNTLANTGIPQAPTPNGTFAIYARYTSTTMKGVNPNGTPYDDPNIPWVSYFNGGDALHGFIRASYGFPQSVGCVEMPFSSAQTVFGLTTYGTLVTVS